MQVSAQKRLEIIVKHEMDYSEMIYNQIVNKRVANMTKDTAMEKTCVDALINLEKKRDALLEIKKEIEAEIALPPTSPK
jgi:hypothetical protein